MQSEYRALYKSSSKAAGNPPIRHDQGPRRLRPCQLADILAPAPTPRRNSDSDDHRIGPSRSPYCTNSVPPHMSRQSTKGQRESGKMTLEKGDVVEVLAQDPLYQLSASDQDGFHTGMLYWLLSTPLNAGNYSAEISSSFYGCIVERDWLGLDLYMNEDMEESEARYRQYATHHFEPGQVREARTCPLPDASYGDFADPPRQGTPAAVAARPLRRTPPSSPDRALDSKEPLFKQRMPISFRK